MKQFKFIFYLTVEYGKPSPVGETGVISAKSHIGAKRILCNKFNMHRWRFNWVDENINGVVTYYRCEREPWLYPTPGIEFVEVVVQDQ